jgi:hypothetical protein
MITQKFAMSGGGGPRVGQEQYGLYQLTTPTKYVTAFDTVSKFNQQGVGSKIVEVTICHPKRGDADDKKDFDDPRNNRVTDLGESWRPFENTKLAIQVTFYYRLFIPFANAFIWYAAYGDESAKQIETMKYVVRTKKDSTKSDVRHVRDGGAWTLATLKAEADAGHYIMPIRASYAMRMMSNFAKGAPLPNRNECRVPWGKKGN